ncbi:MAG TPA: hypothetical protein PKD51_12015 [Saprospiraceae bacterium]|nr:hypothetical protein [Saprospiraceae bacterium]
MDHKFDKVKKALTPMLPLHTDKEVLWDAIEQELDRDKRRRRPIVLFIILLGLGLAFAGVTLAYQHKQTLQKSQNIAINNQSEQHKSQNRDSLVIVDSTLTIEKMSLGKSSTISSKNNIVKSSDTHNEKSISLIHVTEKKSSLSFNQTPLYNVFSDTQKPFLKPTIIDSETKIDTKDNLHKEATITTSPVSLMSNEFAIKNEKNDLDDSDQINLNNIPLIPILRYTAVHRTTLAKNNLERMPQSSKVNLSVPSKIWELHVSSGIHVWNKFDETFTPELQNISQKRKAISTPKESLMATVMVKKEILPNWYIGMGLQYNQLAEIIQTEDISVTTKEIKSDSAFYYEGVSGVDYFSGNIKQTQRKGFLIYSPNYIRRWNFPLELSYRYKLGRLQLVPSIAMLYNISQRYEGITIGMDDIFIYKDKEAFANIYKSSGIVSWSFAIDAEWFISNSTAIKMGVVNQNDLSSALLNETLIGEKYRQLGVRIGLVKTFLMAN